MLAGPFQHFNSAILSSWRGQVAGILTSRLVRVFGEVH